MLRNEIRIEIFEYLKNNPSDQIGSLVSAIERKHDQAFIQNNIKKINEVLFELFTNNILIPGTGSINNYSQYLPFYTLTEYGKEIINQEGSLPYDTDKYINEIKRLIPEIDEILLLYLGESKTTYNKEHLLSATITLGIASEKLILLLIDSFIEALKDKTRKAKLKKQISESFIYSKHKIFRKNFDPIKGLLPKEIIDKLDIYLDGIFNFIRENRNEAGHPTGISMTKKELFANLQLFSDYAKKIYSIINYLKTNEI